ncbi:MAG: PEP-CTERM sorting domain-containing protein [Okeania sp. SIO3B5]|uniref:PEP-CTERM sorting domain-containing protein n=1 Tax=Okeania sp. SIO3B5 TaxID=2607811 RepID=UPI001401817C|nr:PEP-CTERM sorting domain-containing protein [Okeania sp. SIO3B5]NEO51749.1 PEP-CTERM sorting domain-containing protein [Okeania sp. SIO3B5]
MMFKRLKTTGISFCATLAILFVGSGQTNAATITYDSEIYDNSNPNTCTSPLSAGKCFMENGFNVAAFSAQEIGSPSAYFSDTSHFHARQSYEAQHFTNEFGLLGSFITLKNGGIFSLESLDYQLRKNENAITGYTTDDTKILISTTFDPTMQVAGQFVEYSIGNDISLPFQTLSIDGFENITQVYIASSGDVNFDNIILTPVPEPTSILGLLAFATLGATSMLKRQDN